MQQAIFRQYPAILILSLGLFFAAGCGGGSGQHSLAGASAPSVVADEIPALALWEQNMKDFGRANCEILTNQAGTFDDLLLATYYDAEWIYLKIADYTGDDSWRRCAEAAERIYRDQYLLANNGQLPGYWVFSHGLLEDYRATDDQASRHALALLAKNSAFAGDTVSLDDTRDALLSREVAYQIMTNINLESTGSPHRQRLDNLVEQAYGHLDQWFVSGSAPYVRPFMVSLTAHALIMHFDRTGDPRVVPALSEAADWLWQHTWLPQSQAFMYTDRPDPSGGMEPAPDLNLMVAPLFGWLYLQTGEDRFRERGDQIFAGGVNQAYLGNGKHFQQNYRLSIEYVRWRGVGRMVVLNHGSRRGIRIFPPSFGALRG